jgi:hypothetical protein
MTKSERTCESALRGLRPQRKNRRQERQEAKGIEQPRCARPQPKFAIFNFQFSIALRAALWWEKIEN